VETGGTATGLFPFRWARLCHFAHVWAPDTALPVRFVYHYGYPRGARVSGW